MFVLDLTRREFEGWLQRLPVAPSGPPPHGKLSPREMDLLAGVAAGLGNKQIARRFSISENTVRNHLTNIYRKLDVRGRTEAVHWAYHHGLPEAPADVPAVKA